MIDRVVSWVNPRAGLIRYESRARIAALGETGYIGASGAINRLRTWITSSLSGDAHSVIEGPTLRSRALDAWRNIPVATSAINTAATNVIGLGLSLQSVIDQKYLGVSEDAADAWQEDVERRWRLWAESHRCDAGETLTFAEMQELAFVSQLVSGDVFALLPLMPADGAWPFPLRVHLIEGHQVSNPDNRLDTTRLAGGVETDEWGRPVAYHVTRTHPGSFAAGMSAALTWERIPAFGPQSGRRNVIHLYRPARPGDRRGITYLAPVLDSLKQLGDLTTAELQGAVIGAMLTVFITSERGNPFAGATMQGGPVSTGPSGSAQPVGMAETPKRIGLGYGSVVELAPGEKAEAPASGRPNPNFDPFFQSIVMQIGAALEQPHEVLMKRFMSSYSASRGAMLQAWKFYKSRRAWFARRFCQPVYDEWLACEVAAGRIFAPGFHSDAQARAAWSRAVWQGPPPGNIDDVKEAEGSRRRLANFTSTYEREARETTGMDFDTLVTVRAREARRLKAAGLLETLDAAPTLETAAETQPSQNGVANA